jgi:ribosomal protein S2
MKFFGGIQNLKDIPDLVFIIGQDSEMNAVRECLKLQKMNPVTAKVAKSWTDRSNCDLWSSTK